MATPQQSSVPGTTRALAATLLVGTTLAVALAVSVTAFPPAGGQDATRRHHRRSTFLWISAALLVATGTALWIVRSSTRARAWLAKQGDVAANGAGLLVALAALALAVGTFGLWASVGGTDPDVQPQLARWPIAVAMAIAAAWIAAAVALLGMGVVAAVRGIRPGQETPPALRVLRCSCCSPATQRVALAFPFVVLAATSGALWHGTATTVQTSACEEAATASHLLLGSAVIFGAIVVALALATAVALILRKRSAVPASHARRRACHAMVFLVLVGFATAELVWAVKSWRWLRGSSQTACAAVRAVRFTTGALFTSGGLLLALTGCCRLERHLLPTAATPQVDLSMLSPHAIRPPALTKSPEPQDAV